MNGSKVFSFTSQGNLHNLRENTKKVVVKIYISLDGSPKATPFATPVTCDMIGNQVAV